MHLFVAGTDTGVGKTVTSIALSLKLKRRYWKPIQSGTEEETDSEVASRFLGAAQVLPEAYRLSKPLSPHLSSRLDGVAIDVEKIHRFLESQSVPLIIEGAGGLLVPLNETHLLIDLIAKIPCEVLLVARSTLGTINHTLLSLDAMRWRNINIKGVIVNGVLNPENSQAIEVYGKTRVLGVIPQLENLDLVNFQKLTNEILVGQSYEH